MGFGTGSILVYFGIDESVVFGYGISNMSLQAR